MHIKSQPQPYRKQSRTCKHHNSQVWHYLNSHGLEGPHMLRAQPSRKTSQTYKSSQSLVKVTHITRVQYQTIIHTSTSTKQPTNNTISYIHPSESKPIFQNNRLTDVPFDHMSLSSTRAIPSTPISPPNSSPRHE